MKQYQCLLELFVIVIIMFDTLVPFFRSINLSHCHLYIIFTVYTMYTTKLLL
jgi:hypothetical protein